MKIIKACFKFYHQKYQQAGSDADSQAKHINSGISFVPLQVSQGGFKIIFKHCLNYDLYD
jgi:hypothetical protein